MPVHLVSFLLISFFSDLFFQVFNYEKFQHAMSEIVTMYTFHSVSKLTHFTLSFIRPKSYKYVHDVYVCVYTYICTYLIYL